MTNTGSYVAAGYVMKVVIIVIQKSKPVDFENEYLSKQPGFECIMPDGTLVFPQKEEKKAEIKLKRLHRSINLFEDIQMEEKTGNQFPLSK
jgi:hypothetical protein